MKKNFLMMAVASLLAMNATSPIIANAAEKENSNAKVQRVVNQCLYVGPSIEDNLIEMYTSSGWSWNQKDYQFERQVVYADADMIINGKNVSTDSKGQAEVKVEDGDVVRVKSLVGQEEVSKKVNGGDEIIITENICVNDVIKKMDNPTITESTIDGEVQIGQRDKELPNKGDVVTCNRFNGPNGDGKYYSDRFSYQALKNFYMSDCDRALAKSAACLADYLPDASKRYCSLYSPSHYGKCSSIIGHSTRYHRH
jgi:hypothetical protein